AIDFDATHFVGVSEYWHVTHGVFSSSGGKPYDLESYKEQVDLFCNQSWSAIQAGLLPRKKDSAQKVQDAQEACFKASWLINVLYEGIGVPVVTPNVSSPTGPNISEGAGPATEDGAIDSFMPVNKIHGTEFSWTLGTMLLYASAQIPPTDTSLPVGLGSAVSGIAADFDPSGTPQDTYPDDEADALPGKIHAGPGIGTLALILVAVGLLMMLLCGRDRRGRIIRKLTPASRASRRRRRSGGSGMMKRVMGFSRRLFKRDPVTYERILEEGSAADIDDDDSDDAAKQPPPSSLGLRTFKDPHGRFDERVAHTSIDTRGLVVRTESRDRLNHSAMGKRSRAGSPTR
ncbi:hypothetical protein IMZ48_04065, partial [Candidatus Bathyarchaeota archaeon]|nr:hypothetical protein [Candidatus Bathyarchaeota archaeon]